LVSFDEYILSSFIKEATKSSRTFSSGQTKKVSIPLIFVTSNEAYILYLNTSDECNDYGETRIPSAY
jgi:hypothetical protein